MAILEEICELLQKGRAKNVKALVQQALDVTLILHQLDQTGC